MKDKLKDVEFIIKIETFEDSQWVGYITIQHKPTMKIGKKYATAKTLRFLGTSMGVKMEKLYEDFLKDKLKDAKP